MFPSLFTKYLYSCIVSGILFTASLSAQYQVSALQLTPPFQPERMDRLSASSDGFYWIGGARGLFRINLGSVEKVVIPESDGSPAKDQIIQSKMIEDSRGNLWFSTYSSFYQYDPVTEKISQHFIEANGQNLREEYQPIFFDSLQQELWLRAGDRLWAYNTQTSDHRPLSGTDSAMQYTVLPTANGKYRISGARWIFNGLELITVGENTSPAVVTEVVPEEKVICALQISKDSILIGTKEGLKLIDLRRDSLTARPFPSNGRKVDVTSMESTATNELLVSYAGTGIAVIDPRNGKEQAFLDQKSKFGITKPDQLLQTELQDVLVTQINKNIYLLEKGNKEFKSTPFDIQGSVKQILVDDNGKLFVLTVSGKVWAKTLDGEWEDLLAGEVDTYLPRAGNMAISGGQLFVSGGRNFWVITDNQKKRFDKPDNFMDRLFIPSNGQELLLTLGKVNNLTFTDKELKLTPIPELVTSGNALFSGFFPLHGQQFLLNHLPSELWRISFTNNNYQVQDRIKGIGQIYCGLPTKSGLVYVGGNEGLFKINGSHAIKIPIKTGQFRDPDIQTITEDKSGRLWLGTSKGLLAYNPTTQQTIFFSSIDGLSSSQFKNTPPILHPKGEIWMVTNSGDIIAFDPEKLIPKGHLQPPYIAKIWTNEEPLQSDTSSHYLKRLELNYLRNTLKFKVAAKGFGRSAASGIRYQMLGYEDKPAYTDFNTTIRYPNLPPGDYTLQLTAINQNGLPSGARELAVIIRPPFTQTLTFKLLAGLGLILLVGGGYAILLRRERQRQQRIQEQQARLAAERDRIAGEVHDDLGGQLSSIMYLSEELLLTEAAPGTERELNRINELSRNSLQNVRDIIFALDNRRGSIADLGEQLRGTGQEFFGDRSIAFEYEEKLEKPDYVLSSRQKRNLLLITKEAWHNTAKHANATKVRLQFKQSGEGLQLLISDDGRGFDSPESNASTGGYGLDNMREKATSIGGQILIESAVGEGTSLTISTPLKPGT